VDDALAGVAEKVRRLDSEMNRSKQRKQSLESLGGDESTNNASRFSEQRRGSKTRLGLHRTLILFARHPIAGRAKTRLIPALGAEGAAALHRRLVLRALRTGHEACRAGHADFEVHFDGGTEQAMSHWLGDNARFLPQASGDLGERIAGAFEESFRAGSTATVIIGSDCPDLSPEVISTAFARLTETPVVLGPAQDGGYYLIGMSRPVPELFRGIPWGTDRVLADSLAVLERRGWKAAMLNPLTDIDRPEDLAVWHRITAFEDTCLDRVSVIIPALNEERHIAATLCAVGRNPRHEVIVVDGGSTDGTVQCAKEAGAAVVASKPGRARQMNAGAARAGGGCLLFLHADTLLPPAWAEVVPRTLCATGVAAGAFRFRIAGSFRGKSFIEWTAGLRSQWLQRPYGDQGLFLARALFEEMGGFANLPIMEDYEFAGRLRRRGRIVTVGEAALTSGRRWQTLGVVRTTLRNQWMLTGYHAGVPLHKLARGYQEAKVTSKHPAK
jgi:rSAM/selenodomain-associated transferase 2/rSAM/selenodomain-associated transferase 1